MTLKPTLAILLCGCALAVANQASAQAKKPDFNVQRKQAPTPEVLSSAPNEILPGKTTTIVMKVKNASGEAREARADGPCKLNSFKFVPPGDIQFNVTAEQMDDGGACELQVQVGGHYFNNSVAIAMTAAGRAHEQQREREESERRQREGEEQIKKAGETQVHVREVIGKKWEVKLPNGKSDTWTLSNLNYSMGEFKNAKGQQVMVVVGENDEVIVQPGQNCMFTGTISGGKITAGESSLPTCPMGSGGWSATISK